MDILQELESQRDRIDAAIRALTGGATGDGRRHRASRQAVRSTARRRLSAAARKRISDAAKARWAKAKKAGRNSL